MQWGAHTLVATGVATVALGELSRLVLAGATPITIFLFFVGGVLSTQLGSVLPDLIDFASSRAGARHRNRGTHGIPSVIIPLSLGVLGYSLFLFYLPAFVWITGGMALGWPIGWATHLLLDALTPHGIPLPAGQFSWDWAPYDSPAGNRVLKVVGGLCVLAGLLTLLDPVIPLFLPLLAALWASRWRSDRVRDSDVCLKTLTTDNVEVVATLTAISIIFRRRQLPGDNGRAIAYRNAARSIRNLRWSLKADYTRTLLEKIEFVGVHIAGVIKDVVEHGHSKYLDSLQQSEMKKKKFTPAGSLGKGHYPAMVPFLAPERDAGFM